MEIAVFVQSATIGNANVGGGRRAAIKNAPQENLASKIRIKVKNARINNTIIGPGGTGEATIAAGVLATVAEDDRAAAREDVPVDERVVVLGAVRVVVPGAVRAVELEGVPEDVPAEDQAERKDVRVEIAVVHAERVDAVGGAVGDKT